MKSAGKTVDQKKVLSAIKAVVKATGHEMVEVPAVVAVMTKGNAAFMAWAHTALLSADKAGIVKLCTADSPSAAQKEQAIKIHDGSNDCTKFMFFVVRS